MTNEQKARLGEMVVAIAELLGRELSPVSIQLYLSALDDLDYDLVQKAMGNLVQNSKWMPTPADIRQACCSPECSLNEIALVQGSRVAQSCREISCYNSVTFDDPVTMAVVKDHIGGWPITTDICRANKDSLHFFMKDFSNLYAAFAKAGVRRGGFLAGRNIKNSNLILLVKRPQPGAAVVTTPEGELPITLIGDFDRAMKVLENKERGLSRTELDLVEFKPREED